MAAGLLLLGVASGVLAGLLGVGGGIVIVPLLSIAFGVPHVLAKGTSLAVILPTAIMGTIRNRRTQPTALRPAMGVGMAGVISALLASQISLELAPSVSRARLAVLLVVSTARIGQPGWASMGEEPGSLSHPPHPVQGYQPQPSDASHCVASGHGGRHGRGHLGLACIADLARARPERLQGSVRGVARGRGRSSRAHRVGLAARGSWVSQRSTSSARQNGR